MQLALATSTHPEVWRQGDHRDLDTALVLIRRQYEQQIGR